MRGWLQHKGEKHLIGTYRTDEEAARAWDRTAIWLRGPNTQTNFPISHYLGGCGLECVCKRGRTVPCLGVGWLLAGAVYGGRGPGSNGATALC